MKAFLLTQEPWIPVRLQGRSVEVSLEDALLLAHKIERLEDPSPLVEAALFRLLLAVIHRALEGPEDRWTLLELHQSGQFPKNRILRYLNAHRERFWLFHPEAPFYQVADLPTDNPAPWTKLRAEIASGNNPTLFSHAYDDNPTPVGYAEAARHLVAHQSFAPGGLIRRLGVTSAVDAPLARAAVFIPQGANLFESLVYSLVPYTPEGDEPIWEAPPVQAKELLADARKRPGKKLPFEGRTRVYTWLSRGIRLIPERGYVRFMGYGPGIDPLEPELYHHDPHVAYRSDRDRLLPVRLREDRAFWRDFTALYPEEGSGIPPAALDAAAWLKMQAANGKPVALSVYGQVTDQSKVLEIRREHYPLPTRQERGTLRIALQTALERVEETADCLRKGARVMASRLLSPERTPDPGEVRALVESFPLLPLFYQRLGGEFPRFLVELDGDLESAHGLWREAITRAQREAWQETRNAIGTEARALKALQEGERALLRCLNKEASR